MTRDRPSAARYAGGFLFSFLNSLSLILLAALASLFAYNADSFSASFAPLAVFFLVPSLVASLVAAGVATGLFALGSRSGSMVRGCLIAGVGLFLLGAGYAVLAQQIPTYDVTLLLITGCCAGALAGPVSFMVSPPARH